MRHQRCEGGNLGPQEAGVAARSHAGGGGHQCPRSRSGRHDHNSTTNKSPPSSSSSAAAAALRGRRSLGSKVGGCEAGLRCWSGSGSGGGAGGMDAYYNGTLWLVECAIRRVRTQPILGLLHRLIHNPPPASPPSIACELPRSHPPRGLASPLGPNQRLAPAYLLASPRFALLCFATTHPSHGPINLPYPICQAPPPPLSPHTA